jgi:broad specificity phosphatase PhoE
MAIPPSVVSAVPSVGMLRTSTTLLLLRHGQSEWNAVRRWQGSADTPLTSLGRQQALSAADRLSGLDVDFCGPWSSDLGRAASTASTIADAIGLGPTIVDRRLREASAGEWEGLTPHEIEVGYPGWLAAHRRPPSFEPFEQVVIRAVDSLRSIAAGTRSDDVVPLVVTHSGVIRSLVRQLGETDSRIPNLGGVWLTIDSIDSITGDPSENVDAIDTTGIAVRDLFDPGGIVVSGVDIPGEDPR